MGFLLSDPVTAAEAEAVAQELYYIKEKYKALIYKKHVKAAL